MVDSNGCKSLPMRGEGRRRAAEGVDTTEVGEATNIRDILRLEIFFLFVFSSGYNPVSLSHLSHRARLHHRVGDDACRRYAHHTPRISFRLLAARSRIGASRLGLLTTRSEYFLNSALLPA